MGEVYPASASPPNTAVLPNRRCPGEAFNPVAVKKEINDLKLGRIIASHDLVK
ncbi:MAG: hypothetical protein ND866_12815 [Pyrinomonadaceae bacterium]|nr:hypothetical protein [Pyrinomonadaceae bacterium]